jgi:hypothetical protein
VFLVNLGNLGSNTPQSLPHSNSAPYTSFPFNRTFTNLTTITMPRLIAVTGATGNQGHNPFSCTNKRRLSSKIPPPIPHRIHRPRINPRPLLPRLQTPLHPRRPSHQSRPHPSRNSYPSPRRMLGCLWRNQLLRLCTLRP